MEQMGEKDHNIYASNICYVFIFICQPYKSVQTVNKIVKAKYEIEVWKERPSFLHA